MRIKSLIGAVAIAFALTSPVAANGLPPQFIGLATQMLPRLMQQAQHRNPTGGGYHHQDGGPDSEYIADCVDRLPAWGYRNPCRERQHGGVIAPRGRGGNFVGRPYGGMTNQYGGGQQRVKVHVRQFHEEHRRTVTVNGNGGQQRTCCEDNAPGFNVIH